MKNLTKAPLKIYYSYAKEDEDLQKELAKHLNPLVQASLIETWHESDMQVGKEWEKEMQDKLMEADIILMLMSSDFLYADRINNVEIPMAIKRHKNKKDKVLVVPILLRNCFWDISDLSKFRALPISGKPVSRYEDKDTAYTEITKEIYTMIQKKFGK